MQRPLLIEEIGCLDLRPLQPKRLYNDITIPKFKAAITMKAD